jgi:hypothetical protein
MVEYGPAKIRLKSSTRIPDSGPDSGPMHDPPDVVELILIVQKSLAFSVLQYIHSEVYTSRKPLVRWACYTANTLIKGAQHAL